MQVHVCTCTHTREHTPMHMAQAGHEPLSTHRDACGDRGWDLSPAVTPRQGAFPSWKEILLGVSGSLRGKTPMSLIPLAPRAARACSLTPTCHNGPSSRTESPSLTNLPTQARPSGPSPSSPSPRGPSSMKPSWMWSPAIPPTCWDLPCPAPEAAVTLARGPARHIGGYFGAWEGRRQKRWCGEAHRQTTDQLAHSSRAGRLHSSRGAAAILSSVFLPQLFLGKHMAPTLGSRAQEVGWLLEIGG